MRVIPCPLCAAATFSAVASRVRGGVEYHCVRCSECGFYYVNPEPTVPELEALYDADYRDRHSEVWHGLEDSANRSVIAILRRRGIRSLVDLGAGQGRFVAMARDTGILASGVEPVFANVAVGRSRYGVNIEQASVGEFLSRAPRGLECVTLLNVLEHLPDPLGVARGLYEALRPGGIVLAIVPNVAFTLALGRLRSLLGFQDIYMLESPRFSQQGFDPPVHLSSFDAPHLRAVFDRAGFHLSLLRHAPVIATPGLVVSAAKHAVRVAGRLAEVASVGHIHWGYSLLALASRPA